MSGDKHNQPDEPRDEALMSRIQNGDHAAFSALVRRHTDRFYACAYRLCTDAALAEDIVQEAFLKIWARPSLWKPGKGAKFTTWFYRVVTNMTLDALRRKKPVLSDEILNYTADERAGQEEDMIFSEEEKALETAIFALPERQKAALNLCFYDGLSNKEAAEALGIGVKALESLIMRAKAGVKEALIRDGVIEDEQKDVKTRYG